MLSNWDMPECYRTVYRNHVENRHDFSRTSWALASEKIQEYSSNTGSSYLSHVMAWRVGPEPGLGYVGEFFSNEVQVNQSPPPISGYAGCIYSSEKMEGWLQHLRRALCLGDPAWPHMESQAKEAIQSLEDMAKAFVWGQTNDWSIVKCFMEQGGLAILCEALLTYALPWSIKMQVYQSFCMVVQNAKDWSLSCDM